MSELKKFTVETAWLNTSCLLGEGPHFDREADTLFFVDIDKHEMHCVDLRAGAESHQVLHKFGTPVGCMANVAGSPQNLVYAAADGIAFFNTSTAESGLRVADFWTEEEQASGKAAYMRSNDGNVDPQGRFWVGTMCEPHKRAPGPEGVLFRFDADGSLHRMLEDVCIPNGMSWTDDGRTVYFTDTGKETIYAFDWNGQTGEMGNRRTFWSSTGKYEGAPDGHAMDADGNLWVALFGSGKVVQLSPQAQVLAEIELPTRCVTCPVFVGEDLVITTGSESESAEHPESAKHAGKTFRVNVGVRGQVKQAYRRAQHRA